MFCESQVEDKSKDVCKLSFTIDAVPFSQSEELYDALEAAGCDVTFLALDGAEHADLMFFQDEVWQQIIAFFKRTL
jgi:fermentation-respiration switch protein FrsA (DUF1100 family)